MSLTRILNSPQAYDIALTFLESELKSRFQYTDEQKERIWLKFVARATAHERRYKREFAAMFIEQRDEVLGNMPAKSYQKAVPGEIETWLFDKRKWNIRFSEMGQLLLPMTVEEAGEAELGTLLTEVSFEVSNPRVREFVLGRAIKLKRVNDTTIEAIRGQLVAGIDAGEGIPQLRKRISTVFETATRHRAQMIARSEVIRASNAGAEEAYIQSGVVLGKTWYAALDERSCLWCSDLHEKTMGLGQNFYDLGETLTVNGQTMVFDYEDIQYPPAHPMCRCTLLPILSE